MCESLRKNIKTTPFQSCQSLGQKATWVITKLIFALPQTLSTCSHRNYAEFPRIQRLKLNFNVSFKVGSDMSKYSFIKKIKCVWCQGALIGVSMQTRKEEDTFNMSAKDGNQWNW